MTSPSLQFVPQWLKKPTTPGGDPASQSAFAFGKGPASPRQVPGGHGQASHHENEAFSLQMPSAAGGGVRDEGHTESEPTRGWQPKGSRPQRYTKDQMMSISESERSQQCPPELLDWTVQLRINSVANAAGQHGSSSADGPDGQADPNASMEEDRRVSRRLNSLPVLARSADGSFPDSPLLQPYLNKRFSRDRPDFSSPSFRRGNSTTGNANGVEGGRPAGRSLGFGRGEGGGAFGGGESPVTKNANRYGILEGDGNEPHREKKERNPWRDAETGFRDKDRGDKEGGMSGGGRYIPANGAAPAGDRSALAEKRGFKSVLTTRKEGDVEKEGPATGRTVNQSSSTWRPNLRHTPSSASGSFEGVLGNFGASASTKQKFYGEDAQDDKRPSLEQFSRKDSTHRLTDSTRTIPTATPVVQREEQLGDAVYGNAEQMVSSITSESLDSQAPSLADVDWYYKDPDGNEQGPFKASQMQEWFTADFFKDHLPLRRSSESTFRSLHVIKQETQSDSLPFLTRPVPKYPPNLPIADLFKPQALRSGHSSPAPQHDSLRQMLAEMHQTPQSPSMMYGDLSKSIHAPLRNGALGSTSPAPIGRTASYTSSPASQHTIPTRNVWENTGGSPAIARTSQPSTPFAPEVIPGMQHMGGFPQPHFNQQQHRSIFDVPSMEPSRGSPFGGNQWNSSPYSPMGSAAPAQMSHQIPHQSFNVSQYGQVPQQQSYAPYPPQQMAQPWQQPPQQQQMQYTQPQYQQNLAPVGPSASMAQPHQQQQQPLQDAQHFSQQPFTQEPFQSPAVHAAQPEPETVQSPPVVAQAQEPFSAAEQVKDEPSQVADSAQNQQEEAPAPPAEDPASVEASPAPVMTAKQLKSQARKTARAAAEATAAALAEQAARRSPSPAPAPEVKPEADAWGEEPATQTSNLGGWGEETASPARASTPSVAPWADDKSKNVKSTSLKEIQEAEARALAQRKAAEAKAKAAAAAAQAASQPAEAPQPMSFGLASRPSTVSVTSSASGAPVWGATSTGSKKQMPKKTLQQIQDEERAKKVSLRSLLVAMVRITHQFGNE